MTSHDRIDHLIQVMMDGGEKAFDIVPTILAKVIEERLWESRPDKDGVPFRSFEAFSTHRLWQGLESSIDDLLAYCRKHPEVQRLIKAEVDQPDTPEEAGAKGGRGNKATDNISGFSHGTSSAYALKRLKRDAPELFRKVVDGEMSANAAAIEAGFRRPAMTIPADIDGVARALRRRFTPTECSRLAALLIEESE